MAFTHRVDQGDCLASIAHEYGLTVKTIWEHPANEALRQKRRTPTILCPGDEVTVPDPTPKTLSFATGKTHTIRIRREKVMLRVKMLSNGRPIANEPYDLTIDGAPAPSGSTNGEGIVEAPITPTATDVVIHFAQRNESHAIRLGHLDPVEQPRGLQARLHQLGFYRGQVDGKLGPLTAGALTSFQKAKGLDQTGSPDDATHAALIKAYGQ